MDELEEKVISKYNLLGKAKAIIDNEYCRYRCSDTEEWNTLRNLSGDISVEQADVGTIIKILEISRLDVHRTLNEICIRDKKTNLIHILKVN